MCPVLFASINEKSHPPTPFAIHGLCKKKRGCELLLMLLMLMMAMNVWGGVTNSSGPAYFIGVAVSNVSVVENLVTMQNRLEQAALGLKRVAADSFHFTVALLQSLDADCVKPALVDALRNISPSFQSIRGVGTFGQNVIFASTDANTLIDTLNAVVTRKLNAACPSAIWQENPHPLFQSHCTLFVGNSTQQQHNVQSTILSDKYFGDQFVSELFVKRIGGIGKKLMFVVPLGEGTLETEL